MIYLSYNDRPSGIYNSQVIDVVKHLNTIQQHEDVKLIALISVRSYFSDRKKIKGRLPQSTVLPMVPKPSFWRLNFFPLFILFLFTSSRKKVMARGPFATELALRLKKTGLVKQVVFDARGAYAAELSEYNVVGNEKMVRQIGDIEREALLQSDWRLAVSVALVNYWRERYGYRNDRHSVVPCTLSEDFVTAFAREAEIKTIRAQAGFAETDKVIVYSGSSAGWQSFELVQSKLERLMEADASIKLVLLTDHFDTASAFYRRFEQRIRKQWVKPHEVRELLLAADYGLLYREQTVTNRVASPVKFAEYLACGLKIIISEQLGDYAAAVETNNLGSVDFPSGLQAVPYQEKKRLHDFSQTQFVKINFTPHYLNILQS
ncbi:MAG: hypothetical protein ACXVPQ_06105 [Bacteroidia bacterium]